MNNCQKFVLDTNIIVSALIFKNSQPRQALDKARYRGIVLMSDAIWQEIQEVLTRPKFERYITLTEIDLFLIGLAKSVKFVDIQKSIVACRDPKDDKFLDLAVNGDAKLIISGDKDLLVLHPFEDIPILTVRQFLDLE